MERETITAGEINLRPFVEEDIPWVYAVSLDPAVQRFVEIPLPYRIEHAEHFVREMAIAGWDRRERAEFVVERASDGERLGRVGLGLDRFAGAGRADAGRADAGRVDAGRVDAGRIGEAGGGDSGGSVERLGGAQVGYWMDPSARGHGVATAAVRALSEWAFDRLHLSMIEWRAEVGNVASRRVAEKAGFRFEGVLRRRLVHRGRRVDAWVGSLLADDMPTRPGSSVRA
nr:GNAT family N-acetyltransferase [uncultured Actinoplanes sp.]